MRLTEQGSDCSNLNNNRRSNNNNNNSRNYKNNSNNSSKHYNNNNNNENGHKKGGLRKQHCESNKCTVYESDSSKEDVEPTKIKCKTIEVKLNLDNIWDGEVVTKVETDPEVIVTSSVNSIVLDANTLLTKTAIVYN